MKPVFSSWLMLLVLAVCCLCTGCFSEADTVRFARGTGVIPDPLGSSVAVYTGDEWVVYSSDGEERVRFESDDPPFWVDDENGRALLYQKEYGVWKVSATAGAEPEQVIPGQNVAPCQSLDGSKALVVFYRERHEIYAFSIVDLNAGKPVIHPLDPPARSGMAASRDGTRICYGSDGGAFNILCLNEPTGQFQLEWTVEDALAEDFYGPVYFFPPGYWSPTGKALLYSSKMYCLKKFDLLTGKRYWIANETLEWPGEIPRHIWFKGNDQQIIMETLDKYGYLQISRIVLDSARETDITNGWINHYSPVLSWDEQYLAYSQNELAPSGGSQMLDLKCELEGVYVIDLRDGVGHLLCGRPFRRFHNMDGPAFSGDHDFVYFEKGGYIYKCFLKSL